MIDFARLAYAQKSLVSIAVSQVPNTWTSFSVSAQATPGSFTASIDGPSLVARGDGRSLPGWPDS